jgi:alpha-methylacyl-CoA racemase
MTMNGPLQGVRVVEMAGLGPGPFAGMVLADMGAEVIRVDRAPVRPQPASQIDLLARGRRSIALDLKQEAGRRLAIELIATADVLLEGFRPSVMERLGLGPDVCTDVNPRLIYGRMTGWGQEGPYAMDPGHDINYIALAGALERVGRADERPVPPLNLVGDFGGGGMLLAFGVTAALVERATSGRGQVIDAAMVDGTALLMSMHWGMHHSGSIGERGTNLLDSGAPFYDVYECADGRYVSVGAIEPQFYERLCDLLGLDRTAWDDQRDRSRWPQRKDALVALFRLKTREEWCAILEHQEACFAPVLSIDEAAAHPHNVARETFSTSNGLVQPAPAPRFSRTPGAIGRAAQPAGADSVAILRELGHDQSGIQQLLDLGAVVQSAGE